MATNHSSGDQHNRIYKKLLDVVPDLLTIEEHGKSKVPGLMDLNMDLLFRTPSKIVIALSHYYKHPSGDMIADPDMEIAVYPDREAAEALTYQDTFGYRVASLCLACPLGHQLNRQRPSMTRVRDEAGEVTQRVAG